MRHCHMPTTTYMGVHARHDHSIAFRVPTARRRWERPTPAISAMPRRGRMGGRCDKNVAPGACAGAQGFAEAFALADRMVRETAQH